MTGKLRIADIPVDGVELDDTELSAFVGGMPMDKDRGKSSGTDRPNGYPDTDADF